MRKKIFLKSKSKGASMGLTLNLCIYEGGTNEKGKYGKSQATH